MIVDKLTEQVIPVLPPIIRGLISNLPSDIKKAIVEIRLRTSKPVMVVIPSCDRTITPYGTISDRPSDGYIFSKEDAMKTLQLMSEGSIYAIEEELRRGYLTLRGGHRVGLVGKVILDGGRVKTLKHISGFNIRITRELLGVGDKIVQHLIDSETGMVYHTLIASPPGCGKTTLIRDLSRHFSDGIKGSSFKGVKVGIVDERSEIAGCFNGIPQNYIGFRTDVLDGCPKAEGIMMLIRSMSPQVIIVDEIGRDEDITAISEAINAGVKVVTTVHGATLEELMERPNLNKLVGRGAFERIIILGSSLGLGTVESLIDGKTMKPLISCAFPLKRIMEKETEEMG